LVNRYRNLTWGILGVLLVPPFVRPLFPGAAMIGPLVFVVLVSRSLISAYGSRLFRVVLSIAMAAVAVRAAGASTHFLRGHQSLEIGLHTLAALGFAFVVFELLKWVLANGPVDADKLYGAVSTYLMIGLAFASIYEAIAVWKPAAFIGASARDSDALFYFSLVTLSTVGYGDVVPSLPETRVLAVTEAILGQLFLAILMARLVGLQLSQSQRAPAVCGSREAPPSPNERPSSEREAS
jgi:voltage-gated potassium channel Kch